VSTSVVKCSWAKCSEGLSNWVFNIIRRYIDLLKFGANVAVLFTKFFRILLVPFFSIVYMVVCFVCYCLILQTM
jgi:hypothetical protein